jgi:hypothetical protein
MPNLRVATWNIAGERGGLPSGEPEVASPVEQRSTATA